MRIKITIAYDGTAYSGWQLQKGIKTDTIQGAVQTALFNIFKCPVHVQGAGRTDSGVHAHGQVAHFDVPSGCIDRHYDWQKMLNAVLPRDIRILDATVALPGFHAQKDALSKTYVYNLWPYADPVSPCARNYVWPCGPLDLGKMLAGARKLEGTHDFASFMNSGTPIKSTVRTIYGVAFTWAPPMGFYFSTMRILQLVITGNGFLKQMVRNMAGLLATVGRGKLPHGIVEDILRARERKALTAPTAPAKGLFLAKINYHRPALSAGKHDDSV